MRPHLWPGFSVGSVTKLKRRILAVVFSVVFSVNAWGQSASETVDPSAAGFDLIEAMVELDSQLTGMVVSSTKRAQRASQTPAVVTVVRADEIQARGYTSLADVLRSVPGFYDVYDLVTHNMGVRGINGGARASGNVIKLMIDGHPVDFRPDTGNFFGEELIPLEAVERVEIIRGPASALYGANAFLGVVNVITRSGEGVRGVHLTARGTVVRNNPGAGASVMLGAKEGPAEVLLAASLHNQDRSGLGLPPTSPALNKVMWPMPAIPFAERGDSQGDMNRPKSFFGKVGVEGVAGGKLSLLASIQNLDSVGEFLDYGTLFHGTRISLVNQNYRATWDVRPTDALSFQVSGHYFTGGPTSAERIDPEHTGYHALRRIGVDGWGFSAEGSLAATDNLNFTVGTDVVQELHLLQRFDQLLIEDVQSQGGAVLRESGTIIPGEGSGDRNTFRNHGAYAQGILTFGEGWSATAGGRVDVHNIYGINPSARLGLVHAPDGSPLSLKLLYGSSFKAPSAVQLYTQPMKLEDIQGNADLKAQTAHTVELAAGYVLPNELGELTVNVFANDILGRVEFLKNGSYFIQAVNLPFERIVGGELDARFRISQPFQLRFSAAVARTVSRDTGSYLIGLPEVTNPLFPPYQLHLIGDYRLPWAGLRLSGEVSYIGPRTSSQSNAVVKAAAYELPPYVHTAAAISTAGRKIFGDHETSISFRVSNLLDTRYVEPGFSGVDVPALGRTAVLSIVQSL